MLDSRRYGMDMDWKTHLTEQEAQRIVEIKTARAGLTAELRRIYDRCQKRLERALGKRP